MRILVAALVLALAAPALADTPSYNYVQGSFQKVDLDDGGLGLDVDGDGFGIGGSFEVADNWHVFGGYSTIDFGFGIELNQLSVGAGYHTDTSATTSMFADLSLIRAEVDAGSFGSEDESGFGLRVGVRSNLTDKVEAEGNIAYVDLGDGGDGTSVGGAIWYGFTKAFSLGLFANADEDAFDYGIGARLYFGQ